MILEFTIQSLGICITVFSLCYYNKKKDEVDFTLLSFRFAKNVVMK